LYYKSVPAHVAYMTFMYCTCAVYLRSKENSADDAQSTRYLKQYIAYTFEQHHSKNPEVMVVALVDMSGAGMGNLVKTSSLF
jgi:hypothetical protein